jgi:phosphate transport system permease protein
VATRATLTGTPRAPRHPRTKPAGRIGDGALLVLCGLASLLAAAILVDVTYELISNGRSSISHFGLSFLWHSLWAPNFRIFGAAPMIYGTLVSSLFALAVAAPLGIAIGLYLSMMARPSVRTIVGPLVEMLAAVPSVILGFWGLLVLAPFLQKHIEPALHSVLGFIPIFGAPQATGTGLFAAGLVLALMILPIIASLSRDLFMTVPRELKEGAEALGATRWEVIRGVVLSTTVSGVAAATVLGLGRALGEAIAVSLIVGNATEIHANLFQPGATLASVITNEFPSPDNNLHVASMFYLALVLLAIGLLASLAARTIAGRFDVHTRSVVS